MYIKRLTSIIPLLALGFGGFAAADLEEDVRCREISFSDTAKRRDMEAFATFIDPDARFVGDSVTHGLEQILAAWQVFFAEDGPTIAWRPQFVEVLKDGTLALTRGPYRVTSVDEEGNRVDSWGTFNSVWRLDDDGQWYIIFDTGGPAVEAPSDEQQKILESTCDAKPSA